jgi:cell volume regulation protein A
MTTGILITICSLLLAAYVFDISASRTRIPAVILLLALGWGLHQGTDWFDIQLPNLAPVLPLLGTIGLILIVFEGALELDLERKNLPMMGKAALMAFLPLALMAFGLAWAVNFFLGVPFLVALTNAIPFAIISSAIAIPTASGFRKADKEFVIYESSISDILGVLLFNFVMLNETFEAGKFGTFGLDLLVILAISFIATVGLAFLLSRIKHHVKFAPIIVIIVLIYGVSKVYHLPGLILIMVFGLFLGNLDRLADFKWVQRLRPEVLEHEVSKLKELVIEGAFLVRSLFFLLFGFQIETSTLLNPDSMTWALGICGGIYLIRAICLMLMRIKWKPLLFIAPRGLITVLLFLSIPAERSLPTFGQSLVIQVVLISSLMMMVGTILGKGERGEPEPELAQEQLVEEGGNSQAPANLEEAGTVS